MLWYSVLMKHEQIFGTRRGKNMKSYNRQTGKRRIKKSKRRTKIANKFRFSLFCAVCAAVMISTFGMLHTATASKDCETFFITVSSGDTLWNIAKENNTQNRDVRKVVDDIVRINSLTGSSLTPGTKLAVPVY